MADEKDLKRILEEHDRRQAVRQVERDIATTDYDLQQVSKPGLSSFLQFVTCDNLRTSLENLADSASRVPDDSQAAKMAKLAEVRAMANAPPQCKQQIERARDLSPPQNRSKPGSGLI